MKQLNSKIRFKNLSIVIITLFLIAGQNVLADQNGVPSKSIKSGVEIPYSGNVLLPQTNILQLQTYETAFVDFKGLKIEFLEVVEDTRCVFVNQCAEPGNAGIAVQITTPYGESGIHILNTNHEPGSLEFGGYILDLIVLNPYPELNKDIQPSDYTASFHVFRVDYLQIGFEDKFVNVTGDLEISFQAVEEDSRCPSGVECIWEGNAKIRVAITALDQWFEVILNTNVDPGSVEFNGYTLRLLDLYPYPSAGTDRESILSEYVVSLQLLKQLSF